MGSVGLVLCLKTALSDLEIDFWFKWTKPPTPPHKKQQLVILYSFYVLFCPHWSIKPIIKQRTKTQSKQTCEYTHAHKHHACMHAHTIRYSLKTWGFKDDVKDVCLMIKLCRGDYSRQMAQHKKRRGRPKGSTLWLHKQFLVHPVEKKCHKSTRSLLFITVPTSINTHLFLGRTLTLPLTRAFSVQRESQRRAGQPPKSGAGPSADPTVAALTAAPAGAGAGHPLACAWRRGGAVWEAPPPAPTPGASAPLPQAPPGQLLQRGLQLLHQEGIQGRSRSGVRVVQGQPRFGVGQDQDSG